MIVFVMFVSAGAKVGDGTREADYTLFVDHEVGDRVEQLLPEHEGARRVVKVLQDHRYEHARVHDHVAVADGDIAEHVGRFVPATRRNGGCQSRKVGVSSSVPRT